MKVNLSIRYHTHWGESVSICLEKLDLHKNFSIIEISLEFRNTEEWGITLNLDDLYEKETQSYFYRIRKNDSIVKEDRSARIFPDLFSLATQFQQINIIDDWNDWNIPHKIYHSDVFSNLHTKKDQTLDQPYKPDPSKRNHFCVTTHLLPPGKRIGILGSCSALNNWDIKRPILLQQCGNHWHIALQFDATSTVFFKYVICDTKTGELIAFEKGNNRIHQSIRDLDITEFYNHFADFSAFAWKGAGVNVPLSGLRSHNDWGIGDFSSLSLSLDWAHSCGFSMIQLLPINDTISLNGFRDSYPYSAISAFAIHPVFLDVKALADKHDFCLDTNFLMEADRLNHLPTMDYVSVVSLKIKALKEIFHAVPTSYFESDSMKSFQKSHEEWLLPYAAFSALRDDFRTADHSQWQSYRMYKRQEIEAIWNSVGRLKTDMLFYVFLQFEIQEQFRKVKAKAISNGIILKGDLPIGVGRYSVETWTRPELFHMDEQAGAPPDAFTQKGQNWFFPTYNWDEMEKDKYQWWKSRMIQLNHFFDAIRLDHILGFFRIWSIPIESNEGLMGRFVPARGYTVSEIKKWELEPDLQFELIFLSDKQGFWHFRINMMDTEYFKHLSWNAQNVLREKYYAYFFKDQYEDWKIRGSKILDHIQQASNMLICAEDLGMVPDFVEGVLQEKEMLVLQVQRMPKKMGMTFSNPSDASYLSVVTPSTHDMSPLRSWWVENRESTQKFYHEIMHGTGEAPERCTEAVTRWIMSDHLNSPAMWSLFLIQDVLSICETSWNPDLSSDRINDPADPFHYWNYRMHINIEAVKKNHVLNGMLKQMISESGRSTNDPN